MIRRVTFSRKITVVGDDEDAEAGPLQQALQPLDAREVQVVGRFVHEQKLRLGKHRRDDREALSPAAGELVALSCPIFEAAVRQRDLDPYRFFVLFGVLVFQGVVQDALDGRARRKVFVLRHITDLEAAPDREVAAVGLFEPRENLE